MLASLKGNVNHTVLDALFKVCTCWRLRRRVAHTVYCVVSFCKINWQCCMQTLGQKVARNARVFTAKALVANNEYVNLPNWIDERVTIVIALLPPTLQHIDTCSLHVCFKCRISDSNSNVKGILDGFTHNPQAVETPPARVSITCAVAYDVNVPNDPIVITNRPGVLHLHVATHPRGHTMREDVILEIVVYHKLCV